MTVANFFVNHNECVITAYRLIDLVWFECEETGEWFVVSGGPLDPDLEIETFTD